MKCGLSDDMIGLGKSPKKKLDKQGQKGNGELDLTGIDEDEIDQVFVGSTFCFKTCCQWKTKTYCFVDSELLVKFAFIKRTRIKNEISRTVNFV